MMKMEEIYIYIVYFLYRRELSDIIAYPIIRTQQKENTDKIWS